MNKEELKKIWEKFSEKNEFKLNPDEKHVDIVAEGVLKNEEKHYCFWNGFYNFTVSVICNCDTSKQL